MPMLTARLTDDEMARLKELAAIQGVSATSLIRKWIEAPPGAAPRAIDHAACDARIAELEGRVGVVTGTVRKTSWASAGQAHDIDVPTPPARLDFLRAPDEDCATCSHDRQSWHLGPTCTFPVGRRKTCGCPEFVEVLFGD